MNNLEKMKQDLSVWLVAEIQKMNALQFFCFISDMEDFTLVNEEGNHISMSMPDSILTCEKCKGRERMDDNVCEHCEERFIRYCNEETSISE